MSKTKNSNVCCPQFNPEKYNLKTHVWKDKLFVTDNVTCFLHIPLNMDSVMTKIMNKIEDNQAQVNSDDSIMLFYDASKWQSQVFVAVSKDIPNSNMVKLSGTFISKVYDGPYQNVPIWMKDINEYILSINKKIKKLYFYYAYCPKCSQKYGHNYCVAFAQIS